MSKTIAAVSTPPGKGGIAVIRISGDKAVEIADRIYSGKGGRLADAASHTVHYGFIKHNGEIIDEVLVTVMRAPKTFTREDVVEINTHGGIVTTRKVLNAVIQAGAYPAEAGEFTKRAFLNGRIDLSQAEAVIDIINAGNDLSQRSAAAQLGGALSREISSLRGELVHLAAQMQVIIDYPDEDLADVTTDDIRAVCVKCKRGADALLKTADSGALIRDGIRAAIVGKPNVGKSSLLNMLARYDRAIVTDVAGTTRDTIEEEIDLNGIPLILIDTAGIHSTDDAVEKIGVEKSNRSLEEADLVIVVLDGSDMIDDDDLSVLRRTRGKKRIILINKNDLGRGKFTSAVKAKANGDTVIEISAVTGEGTEQISKAVSEMYRMDGIAQGNGAVITNLRHKKALAEASGALGRAIAAIDGGMPSDIASIDINEAIERLGEITGETVSDDIVNDIFHSFCVGK
ncbi:MAG: tRNA uridine-5-carboxymethylaminomethyl(34) synthesis GTPase MnmE [Firmicutes bacterium]|nr:tRNA uridine-5-carboxymethylaminomethyl(34) synthesis GTPase MnmE [Bacillota bacterium]